MFFRNKLYKRPSLRISLRYSIIGMIFIILISLILPSLLNYGPESINTQFDIKMSYIPYWAQFASIMVLLLFLLTTITHFLFKSVDKFYLSTDEKKYNDYTLIKKVRKSCFNLPYLIPLFEVLIPLICAGFVLFTTGSHQLVMVFKILVIVFSLSLILAVSSFIFSKDIYNEILTKTYKENLNIGFRINLKSKILLQILPLLAFSISLLTFIGYTFTVREKENVYFDIYDNLLTENFSANTTYTYDDILQKFNKVKLLNSSHTKFIIKPDNTILTLNGNQPSDFIIEYTKQIAQRYNGKTYDSYGVDTQGKTMKLSTPNGECYIGITYNISSTHSLLYLAFSSTVLFAIATFMTYIFSKSMSNDISKISKSFKKLCKNNFGKTLPVTSNDEIGDLINSFNLVQKYSKHQLDLLKDNQEILMEQERLATLGQMVGGIAHNLKTPIMSISGASEGLKDLIKEYDSSIEDPEVNFKDHHEIAADMRNWIEKIDNYTEYMSDIITTVKGQAVTLANQEIVSFTIEELVKRVDILMKHELKHSLITMNIHMNIDSTLTLHGDINSLIQVLNNLISNAIQSYDGAENKNIDLNFDIIDNKLVISIKDYGKGIPEDVQNKLFKEMITTKGKNGTGLGLFMSYSNIRAHFNGNIKFESKLGKGTTFSVILPI